MKIIKTSTKAVDRKKLFGNKSHLPILTTIIMTVRMMMIAITFCTLIAPQLVDQETSAVMIIRGT